MTSGCGAKAFPLKIGVPVRLRSLRSLRFPKTQKFYANRRACALGQNDGGCGAIAVSLMTGGPVRLRSLRSLRSG